MVPFIELKTQSDKLKKDIQDKMARIFETTAFVGGPYVSEFEQSFAAFQQAAHCVGIANGTDALFAALKVLEIGAEHEVIIPANTFIATAEAVSLCGARPVFVDPDPTDFTMDPHNLARAITPRTRAIIPVHLYGQPAHMPEIARIAEAHGITIIEDAAQAQGARLDNKPVGSWGLITCYSFYPSKNLGAFGDAGAATTHDPQIADLLRAFINHGQTEKNIHAFVGTNSKLNAMQAAVLTSKLPHLPRWNEQRRAKAALYNRLFAESGLTDRIQTPEARPGVEHVYHLYVIRTRERDALREFLAEKGIGTAIHYPRALPFTEAYKSPEFTPERFPVSYELQETILSLPMYPELTDDQVREVVDACAEFYGK